MLTLISFIVVLGILVFIHEFGHFIVAKWAGVKVERFSIGFGPSILKKRYGETEYQIACIPLGGYVKMAGEDPSEELEETKEDKDAPPQEFVPDEKKFHTQPVKKRFAIVLAGPLMNIILAFLLVPLVYMMGTEVNPSLYQKAEIGFVDPDSPAGPADFRPGDVIVRINGKTMKNWKKARTYILFHPNRALSLQIDRNGEILTKEVTAEADPALGGGTIGVYENWPSQILRTIPGKPADKAGLLPGDRIVQLGDLKNPHWFQTQQLIQKSVSVPLPVVVNRNGQDVSLTIVPEPRDDIPGLKDKGFIGIEPVQPFEFRRFGLIQAFKLGTQENLDNIFTTFVVVGKLVSGGLTIKSVGGPIQIAEVTGNAAQQGLSQLLLFMAFVSLQLAILNLLPIPVLDGGHIAFMFIEFLKGSPLSIKKRMVAQQVGFALLITLMVVVTFNDVARHKSSIFGFIKGLWP